MVIDVTSKIPRCGVDDMLRLEVRQVRWVESPDMW